MPQEKYLAAFRRRADEVHVALEWAFSATGDPAIGLAITIAAVPLWFELFQMPVACGRLEQALRHAATGSDEEMRLRIALGHALWYGTPESDAIEPTFARALSIAESIGATDVRTQALWGIWAARRSHGDYSAALELARRYADAANSTGDLGAIHLGGPHPRADPSCAGSSADRARIHRARGPPAAPLRPGIWHRLPGRNPGRDGGAVGPHSVVGGLPGPGDASGDGGGRSRAEERAFVSHYTMPWFSPGSRSRYGPAPWTRCGISLICSAPMAAATSACERWVRCFGRRWSCGKATKLRR